MIYVARHGETTWNRDGRYQGRLESPLSELGVRQAEALAARFASLQLPVALRPTRIVTSPLTRCTATANATAIRLHLEPETDERLVEIAHGSWEGRYREDVERTDVDRYRRWRDDPAHVAFDGGERLAEVAARWRSFARDLNATAQVTLVVTHDAVIRCALLDAMQRPLDDFWHVRTENAAFAAFATGERSLTLVEACAVAHLNGLRADVTTQAL